MKHLKLGILCAIVGLVMPCIVSAQGADFFHELQDNLQQASSSQLAPHSVVSSEIVPAIGTSQAVAASEPAAILAPYDAYDAGRDELSVYLAAGAVLASVLIVVFLFFIALGHTHARESVSEIVREQ